MFQKIRSYKPGDILYNICFNHHHGLNGSREPYIVLKEPYLVISEETRSSKYALNLLSLKRDRYISMHNISFWEEWIVCEEKTTNSNKETDNA